MTYQVLSVEDFGRQMLATGDLDPIYVMLNQAQLEPAKRARWSLAYWCFYHAGFASYAADQPYDGDFWVAMVEAARNENECPMTKDQRWPRGTERRHFRGKAAINSVYYLRDKYQDGDDAVGFVAGPEGKRDFWSVRERVMKWPSFGPWIAFKVADMLDAVLGVPVDFAGTEKAFFDDPKEGAKLAWDSMRWPRCDYSLEACTDIILNRFAYTPVPHAGRTVRTQEVETIFCKYKSHVNGRYPVGKDTREIIHGLGPWVAHSETARRCFNALKAHEGLLPA